MPTFRFSIHCTSTPENRPKFRAKFCPTVRPGFEAPTTPFFTSSWPQSGRCWPASAIWLAQKSSKTAGKKFCRDFRSSSAPAGVRKFCTKITSTACRLSRSIESIGKWRSDFCSNSSKCPNDVLKSSEPGQTVTRSRWAWSTPLSPARASKSCGWWSSKSSTRGRRISGPTCQSSSRGASRRSRPTICLTRNSNEVLLSSKSRSKISRSSSCSGWLFTSRHWQNFRLLVSTTRIKV